MVDVLHFLFEEDFVITSKEYSESRNAVREVMYEEMYGNPYPFSTSATNKRGVSGSEYLREEETTYDDLDAELSADVDPFSPRKPETKPFVPATTFDPDSATPFFGLDAPLG